MVGRASSGFVRLCIASLAMTNLSLSVVPSAHSPSPASVARTAADPQRQPLKKSTQLKAPPRSRDKAARTASHAAWAAGASLKPRLDPAPVKRHAEQVRRQRPFRQPSAPLILEPDDMPPLNRRGPSPLLLGELICPTPRSLMLHSAFGAERMQALAEAIRAQGLRTMTYRQLLESLQRGQCPPENAIIVSLDDLGTNWLRPVFREMIQVFIDRDLTLVVAVVAQTPGDPAVWDYLRSLETQGVEVASHTVDHHNLPWLDAVDLEHQIQGSYESLCADVGRCPATLILPFGNIDHHGRVLAAASNYSFVVGISGGLSVTGAPPYYLGRIGPDIGSPYRTLNLLKNTFTREGIAGSP